MIPSMHGRPTDEELDRLNQECRADLPLDDWRRDLPKEVFLFIMKVSGKSPDAYIPCPMPKAVQYLVWSVIVGGFTRPQDRCVILMEDPDGWVRKDWPVK